MPIIQEMMGVGLPAASALAISGSIATGLSGAGTSSQANAFAITSAVNVFSTVAANSGGILPATAEVGSSVEIYNQGANPLLVYPHVGGTINALSANSSFSLTNAKSGIFKRISGTAWVSIFSA
jgi:hypothetical protein